MIFMLFKFYPANLADAHQQIKYRGCIGGAIKHQKPPFESEHKSEIHALFLHTVNYLPLI